MAESKPRPAVSDLTLLPDDLKTINYSQILGNLVDFFSVFEFSSSKNGAKELKNHRILDWCKGKNVKLEKR